MSDDSETKSTTFTYKKSTEDWLLETYSDAIGLNEAIRNAIADARLVREKGQLRISDDDTESE